MSVNEELSKIYARASEIVSATFLSWEQRYSLIFSSEIASRIRCLDPSFISYYDPDTSYEENACAFVEALRGHLTKNIEPDNERDAALEEAALLCDEAAETENKTLEHLGHDAHMWGRVKQAEKLARAIRAMKGKR